MFVGLQILRVKISFKKFRVRKDISPVLKKVKSNTDGFGTPSVFPLHLETKNSIPAFSLLFA